MSALIMFIFKSIKYNTKTFTINIINLINKTIAWVIDNFNRIKKNIIKLIQIFIINVNNRLNKDCLGKRWIKNIKNFTLKINFTRQDIIPLITFIIAKIYIGLIFFLGFLEMFSVNI